MTPTPSAITQALAVKIASTPLMDVLARFGVKPLTLPLRTRPGEALARATRHLGERWQPHALAERKRNVVEVIFHCDGLFMSILFSEPPADPVNNPRGRVYGYAVVFADGTTEIDPRRYWRTELAREARNEHTKDIDPLVAAAAIIADEHEAALAKWHTINQALDELTNRPVWMEAA